MSQCQYCGTRTGMHGFSFGPDGKYSEPIMTWDEFRVLRVNALKELLTGIKIVEGRFV